MTFDVSFAILGVASAFSFIIVFIYLWQDLKYHKNFGDKSACATCFELASKAEKDLKIVTDLSPRVFEDKQILLVFSDAIDKGVQIKILHDPQFNLGKVPEFEKIVKKSGNKIIVRELEKSPPYHFWVADESHLRLEDPHPPGDISKVTAQVRFNTLRLGEKYEKIFDNLWFEVMR